MSIDYVSDKIMWDRFIDESPNSLLFHKWDFLKLIEKYTGYELFPYIIYSGKEPIAAIPLFYIRKKGLKFVYSPPQSTLSYIPYMGFAFSREYAELRQFEREKHLGLIIQELEKALYHLSPNYVSLAVEPGDADARPYLAGGYEPLLQYTYMIDLGRPLESIWKDFDGSCKKSITDAAKLKPVMERSNDSKALFDMMRERLAFNEKTFFKAQSHEYLKEMMALFPDHIKMYSVYVDGEVVSATVNYEYRKRFIGWMGAAAVSNRGFNEYMIWESIKMAKDGGFILFENLGADEKRLNPFKSKFSPSLTPYYYMIKRDALYRTATNTSEMVTRLMAGLHRTGSSDHAAAAGE
jgi:hypothetical protein